MIEDDGPLRIQAKLKKNQMPGNKLIKPLRAQPKRAAKSMLASASATKPASTSTTD